MKRCEKKGCGSYAFNLRRDGIDQGELCDFHYWAARAMRFASALVDVMDCTLDHDFDKITEALKDARLMLNADLQTEKEHRAARSR